MPLKNTPKASTKKLRLIFIQKQKAAECSLTQKYCIKKVFFIRAYVILI